MIYVYKRYSDERIMKEIKSGTEVGMTYIMYRFLPFYSQSGTNFSKCFNLNLLSETYKKFIEV